MKKIACYHVSFLLLLIVVISLFFSGCSKEDEQFANAKKKNCIAAYKSFNQKYPESIYKDQVKNSFDSLKGVMIHGIDSIILSINSFRLSRQNLVSRNIPEQYFNLDDKSRAKYSETEYFINTYNKLHEFLLQIHKLSFDFMTREYKTVFVDCYVLITGENTDSLIVEKLPPEYRYFDDIRKDAVPVVHNALNQWRFPFFPDDVIAIQNKICDAYMVSLIRLKKSVLRMKI